MTQDQDWEEPVGGMHFFNMFNFDKMRRKGLASDVRGPTPPVLPATAPTR